MTRCSTRCAKALTIARARHKPPVGGTDGAVAKRGELAHRSSRHLGWTAEGQLVTRCVRQFSMTAFAAQSSHAQLLASTFTSKYSSRQRLFRYDATRNTNGTGSECGKRLKRSPATSDPHAKSPSATTVPRSHLGRHHVVDRMQTVVIPDRVINGHRHTIGVPMMCMGRRTFLHLPAPETLHQSGQARPRPNVAQHFRCG